MNDAEVMSIIIRWMISEVKNQDYIQKLNIILKGIEGKIFIEEEQSPRFQSIVLFGVNIFPFTINQYREMIGYIK